MARRKLSTRASAAFGVLVFALLAAALLRGFLAVPALVPAAEASEHENISFAALSAAMRKAEPLAGPRLTAAMLKGRPVVVNYFASWCPPCVAEFREFNRLLARKAPGELTVVAVNIYEDYVPDRNGRMGRFLNRTRPQFSVVGPSPYAVGAVGGVRRIPTVYLFDAAGRLRYRFVNAPGARQKSVTADDIERVLELIGS